MAFTSPYSSNPTQLLTDLALIGNTQGRSQESKRRGKFKACFDSDGHVATETRTGFSGARKAKNHPKNHSVKVYETMKGFLENIAFEHYTAKASKSKSPLGKFNLHDITNIIKACRLFEDSHDEKSKKEASPLKGFTETARVVCELIKRISAKEESSVDNNVGAGAGSNSGPLSSSRDDSFRSVSQKSSRVVYGNGASTEQKRKSSRSSTESLGSILESSGSSAERKSTSNTPIGNKVECNSDDEPTTPKSALYKFLSLMPISWMEPLGKGGYGEVSIWQKMGSQYRYAVKLFMENKYTPWNSLEKGEITAILTGDHPHVVKTHALLIYNSETKKYSVVKDESEIPKDDHGQYQIKAVVSEILEGEELFEALKTSVNHGVDTAIKLGVQVGSGLAHIHSKGIIYRDLKPENIMIDSDDNIKIIDFGLSKNVPQGKETKTFCGTPAYLSPEQIYGKPYTQKVDSWEFGALLIDLVVGGSPGYFFESGIKYTVNSWTMYENSKKFALKSDYEKKKYLRNLMIKKREYPYITYPFSKVNGEDLIEIIIALTRNLPEERITVKEAYKQLEELNLRLSKK